MKRIFLLFFCGALFLYAPAQLICFTNPSLEGLPQQSAVPPNWPACFSTVSPGDIQPGQWGITLPPSNGNTYVSCLCFGENPGGYREGFGQMLSTPLTAGVTYSFTLDLAHSNIYNSVNPNGCYSSLQIYGGSTSCAVTQVLWSSGPFFNTNWQQYTVTFTPTGNWNYITFAPYFINVCGTTTNDYINVLVDNISCIQPQNGASYSPVTCSNSCDGDLYFFPSTGTPPYTYNWVPGNFTTQNVSNVCAGTYTVTVTDANSNTVVDTVTIPQPPALIVNATNTNIACYGNTNGTANVTASGGIPGYTYSWSTGATTSFINGLTNGTYVAYVTDANGCVKTDTVMVTSPPSFVAQVSQDTSICTGSVTLSVTTTGPPNNYIYNWQPGNASTSAITVSPITTTTYTVSVSNGMGCTETYSMTVFLSTAPPTPSVTYQNGILTCLSPGYMYQWFLNGNPIPGATQQTYTVTQNGTYYVIITDSSGGCGSMSSPGTVYDYGNGIMEYEDIYNSSLYPNPNSGNFVLHFYANTDVEIKITNTLGEIIYEEKLKNVSVEMNRKIDISGNAKGIYILQISSQKGNATHKINLN